MLERRINSAPVAETKNGSSGASNGSGGSAAAAPGAKGHVKSASISSASGAPPPPEAQPHNASARDLAQPRPSLNSQVSTGGGATGARREFPNPLVFPRNVPSRSTFHSGQTRSRGSSGGAYGDGGSPHQARPSFFSKLSSRFSKRLNQNP